MLFQIDPATGEYYFIEIDEYDPVTGAITAEFPVLGPFLVLETADASTAEDEAATEAVNEAAAE